MSKRTILIGVLSGVVLLGLLAGLFTGSIEQALSIYQRRPAMTQVQGNHRTNTPVATSPAMMLTVIPIPIDTQPPTLPLPPTQQPSGNVLEMDTFQRPDQFLWGRASDDHQWGADANVQPSFSIQNRTGRMSGGIGPLQAVIGQPTQDVDVMASGSVNQFDTNNPNNVNLGIVLRWTDPNNWYKAFIDGQHLTILRDIKGTMSVLAQANVVTSAGVAQTLLFRSFGTLLCAKVWPSDTPEPQNWMLSTRDKTFSTGQFGIRVFEQPHTEITILSFKATAVSP